MSRAELVDVTTLRQERAAAIMEVSPSLPLSVTPPLERNSHAYGRQTIALRAKHVILLLILAATQPVVRRKPVRRGRHQLRRRIALPEALLLPQAQQ